MPRERWHIWTIDAQTGEATQLTAGEVYDEIEPRWSPDGSQIVFCSNRSADPDLDPDAVDLFLVPAKKEPCRPKAKKRSRSRRPLGPKSHPAWSPDGKQLAYLGSEGRERWWSNASLWVVPTASGGEAQNLTAAYDLYAGSNTINDLPGGLPMTAPAWSADGRRLFFLVSRHGSTVLQALDVEGSTSGPADSGRRPRRRRRVQPGSRPVAVRLPARRHERTGPGLGVRRGGRVPAKADSCQQSPAASAGPGCVDFAAYAFARLKFKGSNILFIALIFAADAPTCCSSYSFLSDL